MNSYLPRWIAVGIAGTALDLALFTLLRTQFGVMTLAANTISYSAGTVNNFYLHRRWTFADRPHRGLAADFVRFAAISLSALALNDVLVAFLQPGLSALLGQAVYGALAAKACAMCAGLCWNLAANIKITFARG